MTHHADPQPCETMSTGVVRLHSVTCKLLQKVSLPSLLSSLQVSQGLGPRVARGAQTFQLWWGHRGEGRGEGSLTSLASLS